MEKRDYYDILESHSEATTETLRAAYKRLAFKYHPDHSKDHQATLRMQMLNEAYEILSNPEKRSQYDLERANPSDVPAEPIITPEPANPESVTRPEPTVPTPRRKRRPWTPEDYLWMRNQLITIAWLLVLVTILFALSLLTGEMIMISILVPVLLAFSIVISIVARIKRPA